MLAGLEDVLFDETGILAAARDQEMWKILSGSSDQVAIRTSVRLPPRDLPSFALGGLGPPSNISNHCSWFCLTYGVDE